MSLPASDVFTGADGTALTTYSANWTLNYGNFAIYSNGLRANGGDANTDACAHWNADAFNNDQYSQVNLVALGASFIGVSCRAAASAATFYGFVVAQTADTTYLSKYVAGTGTSLGTGSGAGLVANDLLRIEANGTSIVAKVNGAQVPAEGLDGSVDLVPLVDDAVTAKLPVCGDVAKGVVAFGLELVDQGGDAAGEGRQPVHPRGLGAGPDVATHPHQGKDGQRHQRDEQDSEQLVSDLKTLEHPLPVPFVTNAGHGPPFSSGNSRIAKARSAHTGASVWRRPNLVGSGPECKVSDQGRIGDLDETYCLASASQSSRERPARRS